MRVFSIGFIVIFMQMLLIPLVFVDLSFDRESAEENRMLANRPALAEMKNRPVWFIRQFESWFKDSTGFREKMIRLYRIIDSTGRGVLYKNGQYTYVTGEQGHHFFANNGWMISKFQGKWRLPDEQLPVMAEKLEGVKNYLAKKGIGFAVMFCTDKESVYPEYYPKSIVRGPEPIYLDTVTAYFKENTNADVFNIREAFLAEKDTYLLYNKSAGDLTHYNAIGAFFAYRELMRHLSMSFPEMAFHTLNANDISISYDINEIPVISLKKEVTYTQMDASFFDDVDLIRPFVWENQAFDNSISGLPTILVFRDSYFNDERNIFIGKYVAQHFDKTILIHYANINQFEQYVNKYKPDMVVFESAERMLESFFYYMCFELPALSE